MKEIKTRIPATVNGFNFPLNIYAVVDIVDSNEYGAFIKVMAISPYPLDATDDNDYIFLDGKETKIDKINDVHSALKLQRSLHNAIDFAVTDLISNGTYSKQKDALDWDI